MAKWKRYRIATTTENLHGWKINHDKYENLRKTNFQQYHRYRPYKRRVGVCLPARQKPRSDALRGLQRYFAGGVDSNSDDDFICGVF